MHYTKKRGKKTSQQQKRYSSKEYKRSITRKRLQLTVNTAAITSVALAYHQTDVPYKEQPVSSLHVYAVMMAKPRTSTQIYIHNIRWENKSTVKSIQIKRGGRERITVHNIRNTQRKIEDQHTKTGFDITQQDIHKNRNYDHRQTQPTGRKQRKEKTSKTREREIFKGKEEEKKERKKK